MWNTLAQVADNRRLDKKAFIDFAMQNKTKYGLDDQNMISTWYVDGLIQDFRENDEMNKASQRNLGSKTRACEEKKPTPL